jgi:simple sugar transport system ATP-binding protein
VPDDRVREGLFLDQSITNNIVVSVVNRLIKSMGMLGRKRVSQESAQWIQKLEIKTPSGDLPVTSLSGGNQQRVVLAKWLASNPRILILNGQRWCGRRVESGVTN